MTPLARTDETARAPASLLRIGADLIRKTAIAGTPANDTGPEGTRSLLERRRRRTARRDGRS